jgi:hypothetical protein
VRVGARPNGDDAEIRFKLLEYLFVKVSVGGVQICSTAPHRGGQAAMHAYIAAYRYIYRVHTYVIAR